jgi:hypothetical protein
MRRRILLLNLIVGIFILPVETHARRWAELFPGDIISFIIPDSAPQPNVTTDTVIVTGGKVVDAEVPGCGAPGIAFPVQHYAIVDVGGDRSARNGGLIVTTFHDGPVRPGTRLGSLTFDTTCFIGGFPYQKYVGTVQ